MSQTNPTDYEVTDGGVVVRLTDDEGFDLTSPSDHPDKMRANIAHASKLLADLHATIPAMLAELAEMAADLGQVCPVCEGARGQEIADGRIGWVDCPNCGGAGAVNESAAAA